MITGQLPDEGPARIGPVDLPAGHLVTGWTGGEPLAWVTVDAVPGAAEVWTALSELHPQTGLVPIHLDGFPVQKSGPSFAERFSGLPSTALRPWESREFAEPKDPRAVDRLEAGAVLANLWSHWEGWLDEEDPAALWPKSPFNGEFPGLAPPGDTPLTSLERQWALEVVLPRSRRSYRPMPDTRIGLVAAERAADVPAVIGWRGPVNWEGFLLPLTAVLRSWEDRFGAQVIDVGFHDLRLLAERPPRTLEAGLRVAAEQVVFADECIEGLSSVPGIARRLVDSPVWTFWWD